MPEWAVRWFCGAKGCRWTTWPLPPAPAVMSCCAPWLRGFRWKKPTEQGGLVRGGECVRLSVDRRSHGQHSRRRGRKALQMPFSHDGGHTATCLDCFPERGGERCKIGDAFVDCHPRCRVVAALHPPWRLGAIRRQRAQQGVDANRGKRCLREVDAVINVGVPQLFWQRVGQRLESQRGAIGCLQV